MLYVISGKTNGEKPHFRPDLGPVSPIFGLQKVLFKNLASSVSRYHGQLSCTIPEKANDPFLRKLSGRRTEGQTERRTRMIP